MPAAPQLYRGRTFGDVRATCPHKGNTLGVALKSLRSELELPSFTKKRELRQMHLNFDDWSSRLASYFNASKDNDHALAAVFVLWSRLLADATLADKLIYGNDFTTAIQLAVQPSKCEIRILCGLFLVRATLSHYVHDAVRRLPFDLLEPLLVLARFLSSASNASDDCMRALDHVVRATIIESDSPTCALVDSPQKRLLMGCMNLVGTVEPYLFFDFFHYICDAFRRDEGVDNPTVVSNEYGGLLIAVLRFGDAWHRREAYTQLACSRRGYTDTRLEFTLYSDESRLPSALLRSMRAHGIDKCDSTRLARTIALCGDILQGLTPDVDLGPVGIQLFCLVHDDPLGASVGLDAAVKFALPERPPFLSRYPRVDSWPGILKAATHAVLDMTEEEFGAHILAVAPGCSHSAGYIADVLFLQSLLTDCHSDEWDGMNWVYHRYPTDVWMMYAFCVSHAQSEAVYHGEIEYDDFIAYLESARSLAGADDSSLHVLLLSAVARRAFLAISSHWVCERTHWHQWRALFDIADSAARQYLEACPPDGLERVAMLEVRTTCHILRHGAPNLTRTKNLVEDRDRAVTYTEALYGSPRSLHDTNHALEYFLRWFPHSSQWTGRLRACWPVTGERGFSAGAVSPRAGREAMMHWRLMGHVVRDWLEVLSGTRSVDWLTVPHTIFEALIGTRRLSGALSSCYTCQTRRAGLRTCAGCREFLYCDEECQRLHWDGRDSEEEPHRLACSRTYPARST